MQQVDKRMNYYDLLDEMNALQEEKRKAEAECAERENIKMRVEEMREFLATQTQDITEYDELLVRRMIKRIDVYEDKLTFEFKSGKSIDIRINTVYCISP